ncbi:hypothetical protein LCGC14_1722700, partial [marine sediment metagenome]
MAATIAIAIGEDKTHTKRVTRLGSVGSIGQANTWRTFSMCIVRPDGSGWVQVVQNGKR